MVVGGVVVVLTLVELEVLLVDVLIEVLWLVELVEIEVDVL